jgi:hypothetical protein
MENNSKTQEPGQVVFKVGDTVVARWQTPKGSSRKIRGRVIALKKDKVRIRYSKIQGHSHSISWAVLEVWKPFEQVKKVRPEKGERDPSEALRSFVYGLAGKGEETTDGT